MKIKNRERKKPILPINAMSDIAFLLLIFIMVISLMNYRKEIKINYPEAKFKEKTQADDNFEIWVDKVGNTFYKGEITPLKTIEGLIVDAVVKNPKVRIHIIADKDTPYKNVNKIINILKILQHRVVSLVVKGNE